MLNRLISSKMTDQSPITGGPCSKCYHAIDRRLVDVNDHDLSVWLCARYLDFVHGGALRCVELRQIGGACGPEGKGFELGEPLVVTHPSTVEASKDKS
jgi:hypothetical protein